MRTASLRAKTLTRMTELLKLHERQSMRIAVLMQKLRLNPQVREQSWEADRRRLKAPAPAFKPWQAEALDLEAIELQPEATSERKN